jgi:hypothetical protein
MTRRSETSSGARNAARSAVAYLGEEERWALLQTWLERETASERKAGRRSLRLEALRSMVCPRVKDREWDNVVRENRSVRWVDDLRQANTEAILEARDPSPTPPGNP